MAQLCVRLTGRETRAGPSFRALARAPERPRRGASLRSRVTRQPPRTRRASGMSALMCPSGRGARTACAG
eukprot:2225882-Alexandrium_andersonii.AAC.1